MSERRKFIERNNITIPNYTTIFLLPTLEYGRDFFKIEEFISAYLIDEVKTKLALVFDNTNSEDLKEILYCLQNNENFISVEFDDEDKEVVVIINIPREYSIDFNMFKIGKYSKFSNNYKEMLLDTHGRMTGAGKCIMMSDALFPSYQARKYRADQLGVSINDLITGEVMSIPNMDKELYFKVEDLLKLEKQITINN